MDARASSAGAPPELEGQRAVGTPAERLAQLSFPILVISGGYHPAFTAVCDALAQGLGAGHRTHGGGRRTRHATGPRGVQRGAPDAVGPGPRQAAILSCLPRGRSSRSALGTFYWPEDQSPEEYTGFRRTPTGGEKRAVSEIAPEEIGNAVVHAVRSGGPCQVDDVFQSLNDVFGFNRTGREIRERWSEVVGLLEGNGRIVRRDERLELP